MQYNVVEELATFGLVKYQKKERCFIPTKLAMILAASFSGPCTQKLAKGFMIVETNFKLYGYSTSKLHYQILNYFARIENQLPNLIVGILTRESLYAAFDCGITAEQIIEFLSKNAHPRIANRESAVPTNVTDQLKLWEREKNRVDITPACIYTDFPTQGFFERSVKHARETKALLWKHGERTQLVVIQEKDNEMRTFMKANAASCK
ncbi:general transcription and DNA repair factor IIH subunit TFB2 [Cryptomeria japonica]|uniref:general transcription and DNA repair factor IIH subunit TFB2 n=1 Tax=Cryptomeria japonica TaxID=3369 RepID=UPI0027DA0839|nr:general transcription and DNA repair factor IIH subunit TFB2 [Cryptomeria japonica]